MNFLKFIARTAGSSASPQLNQRRQGGSSSSALVLTALLTCSAGSLSHATPASQVQLEQAANQAITQLVKDYAKHQNWQGTQHQAEHQWLGSLPAQPCSQALELSHQSLDAAPWQRQRFSAHCPSENWRIDLLSHVQVWLPIVVTQHALARDQLISHSDLRLTLSDVSKARRGFFNRLEQVSGQSAKRRLREGQVLHPGLLDSPLLVRRGETVKIVANHQGIQASTQGQAVAEGRLGELIRVRNLSSDKTIEATVIAPSTVQSTTH